MDDGQRKVLNKAYASLKALRTNAPRQDEGGVDEPLIGQYETSVGNLRKAGIELPPESEMRETDWTRHGQRQSRWMASAVFRSKLDTVINYLETIIRTEETVHPQTETDDQLNRLTRRVDALENIWRWIIAVLVFLLASTTALALIIRGYQEQWSVLVRVGLWAVYLGVALADAKWIARLRRLKQYIGVVIVIATFIAGLEILDRWLATLFA